MAISDWCRHCGADKPMTEEHLPPRAAGNASPTTMYNEKDGALTVLASFRDGHTIPSLCAEDNNGASIRGLPQAYALWREDTIGHLRQYCTALHHASGGRPPTDLFELVDGGRAFSLKMEHGRGSGAGHIVNLNPGKIARQVLGMMLAVQRSRELLDDHPQLAAAYYSNEAASIAPFTLHVALIKGGIAYFRGPLLAVSFNRSSGGTSYQGIDCWMIAFAPFLIVLTNGSQTPIEATRIDHWFNYPTSKTFTKQDRKVSYPIADPRQLLVAKLYQDLEKIEHMDG